MDETAPAAFANAVEGYLLARSHEDAARKEAEELCGALPWLTAAQAQDLTHHYVRRRRHLTRQMLEATVDRSAELRREYELRYATLRRRLLRRHAACACLVLAAAAGAGGLAGLLTR
ncbi:hypothetical protein [Streptomyces sp. NPDC053367]|uniref:hypothetical protein n=1 Tax=Streptomyces sp. NPDC053367 TaxID=3365700 RepID=UPI0037CF2D1D